MLGRYEIFPGHGYLKETIEGTITLSEMVDFVTGVMSDPAWSPDFNLMIDVSEAEVALRFEDVSDLAALLNRDDRSSRGYCAFVVDSAVNLGMARMFQTLSDDRLVVEIFSNAPAAEEWLREHAPQPQSDA